MRPAGIQILGPWQGYSQPSRPVAALALALVGVLYTLVPAGRWRNRGKWAAAIIVAALCAARLYLAVDHPTDQLTALIIGVAARRGGVLAGGPERRLPRSPTGAAARRTSTSAAAAERRSSPPWTISSVCAVTGVEPFGLEASAGSTPLRIRVRGPDGARDRRCSASSTRSATSGPTAGTSWPGPSSTGGSKTRSRSPRVRRLVEYEDHLLRLMRDAGLPTPRALRLRRDHAGTRVPDRDGVLRGRQEIRHAQVDDRVIDDASARGAADVGRGDRPPRHQALQHPGPGRPRAAHRRGVRRGTADPVAPGGGPGQHDADPGPGQHPRARLRTGR